MVSSSLSIYIPLSTDLVPPAAAPAPLLLPSALAPPSRAKLSSAHARAEDVAWPRADEGHGQDPVHAVVLSPLPSCPLPTRRTADGTKRLLSSTYVRDGRGKLRCIQLLPRYYSFIFIEAA